MRVQWKSSAIVLIVAILSSVELPNRLFAAQPRINRTQNPIHERAKIEAEQAYQRGDYAKAVELTTSVIRQNPADHVAYYLRGSAQIELGQAQRNTKLVREGISDARESIRLSTSISYNYYLPYLYGMSNLAAIENKPAHAEVCIKVAGQLLARSDVKPDEKANILYQRAFAQVFLKKLDAAIKDYSEAIRLSPKHLGAYVGLADAFAASGNKTKAMAAFASTIKVFPSNPLVYNNRGMYLQRQGRADEAIVDFTRAIEIDTNYFVAYTNRGFALMESGSVQAAENDFNASLKINPNQPMVYSLRGTARLTQGNVESAIQDYQQVIRLDSRNPVAHADLGFAKFFAKDYSGAITAFEQAVALDSQLRYLNPWRSWTMVLSGRTQAASKKFEASLKKDPRQRDWIDRLVAFLMGNISEQELLGSINKTDTSLKTAQTCEAHFFIGQHKVRSGKSREAVQHFQQAIKTNARHLSAFRGAQFAIKQVR